MVTTRRSSQRQDSSQDGSQDSGPSTSSQHVRSTARRSRGGGAAAKRGQSRSLEPIEEDTANDIVDKGAPGRNQDDAAQAEQQGGAAVVAEDASAGDEHRQAPPATTTSDGARAEGPTEAPAHGVPAAASSESESSSTSAGGDEDSDDDDILGPNLMGELASSLRAALQARAGPREASPSPPPCDDPLPETTPGQQLGLSTDPNAIRWQPEVRPVQEIVSAPKRVAPGTGADKEKGLAKQLLAPPRVKPAGQGGSKEDAKRWFELPATKITDDVKTELRLLRLRGAYDPKRFYKSFDETKFPKHFQIGTVVDNPQDFYSSRLTARQRGASITGELLADPAVTAVRKRRYTKLQAEATKHQKVKKRKTEQKRDKAKPKRPKH